MLKDVKFCLLSSECLARPKTMIDTAVIHRVIDFYSAQVGGGGAMKLKVLYDV